MFKLIRKYILFYFIFNRGIVKENLGEHSDALDYFYIALSLNPNSIKTYMAIARICRKNKTCLNGIDFLNKAVWRFPDMAKLYAFKADLYGKIKDYDNAIKEYDLALKNKGDTWEYYVLRAKLKEMKEDFQGALNDYNGAVNFNPKNPELYSQRAFLHFERKNHAAAETDWKKAIELNPQKGHYYYMLGAVQQLMNKTEEAEKNLKMAKSKGIS